MKQSTSRKLVYTDLGLIDYEKAWKLQQETAEARKNNLVPDQFFMLEHPHTFTLGKVAKKEHLVAGDAWLKENDVKIYEIDRGGDITYHGPGQIVGYPIIHLEEWIPDTHKYLRSLEEVLMRVCIRFGLSPSRNEKYTGVWIDNRKIAAIGIKISRWVTMHGFAFNANTNLSLFNGIIPCGINEGDKTVTSLQQELGHPVALNEIKEIILEEFVAHFQYSETERRTDTTPALSIG